MRVDVFFTPRDYLAKKPATPHQAVMLDIFRASSSIITAFVNGCEQLIPVSTIDAAWQGKATLPAALMAGERKALLIPGFDLGNSPFEYTGDKVANKTIIMTTTNGTVALETVQSAAKVFVGSFLNAGAVCKRLMAENIDVAILCAGTEQQFTLEDALCAGLLAERLPGDGFNDAALAARAMYRDYSPDLVNRVAASAHAAYLISIGFGRDVGHCLRHDIYDIVPQYENGKICV